MLGSWARAPGGSLNEGTFSSPFLFQRIIPLLIQADYLKIRQSQKCDSLFYVLFGSVGIQRKGECSNPPFSGIIQTFTDSFPSEQLTAHQMNSYWLGKLITVHLDYCLLFRPQMFYNTNSIPLFCALSCINKQIVSFFIFIHIYPTRYTPQNDKM